MRAVYESFFRAPPPNRSQSVLVLISFCGRASSGVPPAPTGLCLARRSLWRTSHCSKVRVLACLFLSFVSALRRERICRMSAFAFNRSLEKTLAEQSSSVALTCAPVRSTCLRTACNLCFFCVLLQPTHTILTFEHVC